MFNWWIGGPTGGNCRDEDKDIEPPETPAPLFAARAIKSAIFGTPAPPDDETFLEFEEPEQQEETVPVKSTKDMYFGSGSPTKPQGILLTPGTATSRRKTVSFGHEVLDKADKNAKENTLGRSSLRKRHRSIDAKSDQASKPTRLTRALESVREEKAGRGGVEMSGGSVEPQPLLDLNEGAKDKDGSKGYLERRTSKSCNSNQDLMQGLMTEELFDGDMTMDLNEPHSRSGKYWKSEFEQYHEEARAEMKKLTKYKNLAKSYAKKKDAEAAVLASKLKEEQTRVNKMEEKIIKLSAEIASSGEDGQEDDSPMLIKELARQTAMAVQYRAQVEEFRVALEGEESADVGLKDTSHRKVQALLETQRELKRARDQLKERDAIHDDLRDLRKRLSVAEENTKLTQEMLHADLRLEKEIEKSEKRRQGFQERIQKKDEALQAIQNDYDLLKEAAKSQRRDAEQLLKKRHDQVVELKKELASNRTAEASGKELHQALQDKNAENSKLISDYQRQITRLINTQSEDLQAVTLPNKNCLSETTHLTRTFENQYIRDSQIPVLIHSITRPLKALATKESTLFEHPTGSVETQPRLLHMAPLETIDIPDSTAKPQQLSPLGEYTPMVQRFANLSLDTLDMQLPSPEPFILSQTSGRAIHDKKCLPSPRPSMFVIPSSPPKRAIMRSRTSTELARQRSIVTLDSASRPSNLENSRAKGNLPPERAAAAKARLLQKNAEKKRAQAMGIDKENIRH